MFRRSCTDRWFIPIHAEHLEVGDTLIVNHYGITVEPARPDRVDSKAKCYKIRGIVRHKDYRSLTVKVNRVLRTSFTLLEEDEVLIEPPEGKGEVIR